GIKTGIKTGTKTRIETNNGTETDIEIWKDGTEIGVLVKEREKKESLLRDRKNEIANKLSLAGKEKENSDEALGTLEKEIKTCRESIRESGEKLGILELEMEKTEREILKLREEKAGVLEAFKKLGFDAEKLDRLEEINDLLQENKNRLHGNSKELETRIKELGKSILKNRKLLAEGKCPTCGQELEGSEVSGTVEEAEKEKEKLSGKLAELEDQQGELEKKLGDLKAARKLEKQISGYEKELEKFQNNTENSEKLLETHKARIEEEGRKLVGLEAGKEGLESRKKELFSEIEALKEQEEEAVKAHLESETLLGEAKAFEKKLSENAAEIEKLKGKIQASETLIESYGKRAEELEERIRELETRKSEGKAELEKLRLDILALNEKEEAGKKAHSDSEKLLAKAKQLRENLLGITNIGHQISGLEAEIRNLGVTIGFLDKEIQEKSESFRKLEEKMQGTDLPGLEHRRAQFEDALKNIEKNIGEISAEKDGVLKEIGRIETTLKRLSALREDKKALENKRTYLEAVGKNADELENAYMRIRADMRAKNIGALSKLLNEMFSFMYANNAYSHIELDPEYNLTVYRKDGVPLEPKLLSGGERAIFNLILRCAIYRLLSLGFSGEKGDNLPPMILDEPTVFLDKGHIRQLLKLIDLMRNIGVGQIIVVSHDESLIDSADHVFHVEKDPLTNMSSISKN
ncbi:MAG: DNA repair protein Rad50, partial [Methanosarcinaceae archaeon]|nr:DNA repair protein Rad50 [Methanosarcinaceae archaeon]